MKAGIRKNKLNKGFSYTVYVDYGIINEKRKREPLETFQTKSLAEKYRNEIQNEIENNTFIHIPDITFAEAIDEWMTNYVYNKCEPNTYEGYKNLNNSYLKPYLGHYPLKVIAGINGIDIINNYFYFLRYDLCNEINHKTGKPKQNLSYNSVKHHKAQISGIFAYFLNTKRLKMNICLNTTIPKNEDDNKRDVVISDDDLINENCIELLEDPKSVTPEQAILILNLCMNSCIMLPIAFAIFLGLRRSEILGILKNKVNKETRQIVIDSVRVMCGSKIIYKKKNKNKKSTRVLYLPKILIQLIELDEKRQLENKSFYGNEYFDSPFLCVMDNGQPIKPKYVTETFKTILDTYIENEKQKNPNFSFPNVTPHTLRHLNITALLENGAYINDVQVSAGHSDIKTTIHYTHNYNENKKEVADKTDEIYSKYSII